MTNLRSAARCVARHGKSRADSNISLVVRFCDFTSPFVSFSFEIHRSSTPCSSLFVLALLRSGIDAVPRKTNGIPGLDWDSRNPLAKSMEEASTVALARLRVASVQEKTRQETDGAGGPLKIDTGVQPSPWGAIPMQMNCTDTGSAQREGLIFPKFRGTASQALFGK